MDPMNLGLRDWLLIIGPLVIIAILVHGYFRMRRNSSKLRMDLDRSFLSRPGDTSDVDDLSLLRAELPSGGARVVRLPEQKTLDLEDDVPVLMDAVASPGGERAHRPEPQPAAGPERPSKLIVLNVFARENSFGGQELLENLVTYGLKYGEMSIFHCYGEEGDKVLFSLVNAVEPGTFDLQKMGSIETPGVSLFTDLGNQNDPLEAFDRMLDTARKLAGEMDGELRDGARNVMTSQTIEHCRQSVIDYKMKHG